nr:3TM-type holin [uncultured Halomonas sp.]
MNWRDVAETVAKAAPALGGVLAGPAGAGAGTLIARALGVDDNPQAVQAAMHADPQAAIKLREVEASLTQALIQQRGSVVTAEANGESWLQRSWRPLTMLFFVALIGAHWLGFTDDSVSDEVVLSVLDLVQIGIGGYVIGRSAEKVTRIATGGGLLDNILTRRK